MWWNSGRRNGSEAAGRIQFLALMILVLGLIPGCQEDGEQSSPAGQVGNDGLSYSNGHPLRSKSQDARVLSRSKMICCD